MKARACCYCLLYVSQMRQKLSIDIDKILERCFGILWYNKCQKVLSVCIYFNTKSCNIATSFLQLMWKVSFPSLFEIHSKKYFNRSFARQTQFRPDDGSDSVSKVKEKPSILNLVPEIKLFTTSFTKDICWGWDARVSFPYALSYKV